jgi:tetratricopeptide (TPR) repeat protein
VSRSVSKSKPPPLPNLLPFLEQHASTDPERNLRDVLRQTAAATNDNKDWQSRVQAAYTAARYFDYALEMTDPDDHYERGRLHMQLNQPIVARQQYEQALAKSSATDNPVRHARILISLAAWQYHHRQDYDAALGYLDQAITAARTIQLQGDDGSSEEPNNNVSDSNSDNNVSDSNNRRETKDTLVMDILKYQGLMHRSKGDYAAALCVYQTVAKTGAVAATTDDWLDVADMHAALGQWSDALALYERLLKKVADEPKEQEETEEVNRATRAVLLHNLGKVHAQKQQQRRQDSNGSRTDDEVDHHDEDASGSDDDADLDRAIFYCRESIRIKRLLDNDLELAKTLNLLGAVYATKGGRRYRPQALECFQETVILTQRSDGGASDDDHDDEDAVDDESRQLFLHAMRNISILKRQAIATKR